MTMKKTPKSKRTPLPKMKPNDLEIYLKCHLGKELIWLLRAATEWHVQDQIKLNIVGYHMDVYSMDSSFLHARTLFEFFTKCTGPNYYGCNEYIGTTIESCLYENDWVSNLHAYLMHAQDRSKPRQLTSFDRSCMKDLNKMPIDFAKEIVRLWQEFEKALGRSSDPQINALQIVAKEILSDAIVTAENVVNSDMVKDYGVKPITWL